MSVCTNRLVWMCVHYRLQTYFLCSNECFLLAMIYVDRIVVGGEVSLSPYNVHRLVLIALMTATKFFDDVYFSNSFYARVGGLSNKEINVLEGYFLRILKYHLFVSTQEFQAYHRHILALSKSPIISFPLAPSFHHTHTHTPTTMPAHTNTHTSIHTDIHTYTNPQAVSPHRQTFPYTHVLAHSNTRTHAHLSHTDMSHTHMSHTHMSHTHMPHGDISDAHTPLHTHFGNLLQTLDSDDDAVHDDLSKVWFPRYEEMLPAKGY